MLVLTKGELKKLLTMEQAIEAVEKAFISYSTNKACVPIRTQIEIQKENAVSLYMPGYSPELNALGIKVVNVFPKNIERKIPTINALIVLVNHNTGEPLAVLEGGYLTALRTGAASGVASKYLARKDSSKAAIIGCGTQARTQLEAICCVREIKEVKVFDVDKNRAYNYVKDMRNKFEGLRFIVTSSSDEAVKDADIICTATTSHTPVFSANSLKKGVHINAVGAFTPKMQEIGEDVICKGDKICVDSIEAALEEAGDLIIPIKKGLITKEDLYGEIGRIADGSLKGRETHQEITIFKTVGLSVQDMAVAAAAFNNSKLKGLGKEVDLYN